MAVVSEGSLSATAVASALVVSVAVSAVPAVSAASGGVAAAVHLGDGELAVLLAALVESLSYQNQCP